MNINAVILQLRQYCPLFASNVAGAADYAQGLETTVNLPMPCAFAYPLEDVIAERSGMGGSLRQLVEERIAVVVILDNSPDRRGQAAANQVEATKYAIFKALLNWNVSGFTRTAHGLWYGGGHLLGFDRARLFWEFQFYADATIGEDDGFIPPAAPLETITLFDPNHPPVEVEITFPNEAQVTASLNITATASIR